MKSRSLPEDLKARLLDEGLRIAADRGLMRIIGDDLRVLVRIDDVTRKVHYSFRAPDDLSQDDPSENWIQLR
ncbi:MAG: hypothetical protein KKH21_12530 [Gammaproteobacteria bacterium]|nr:hypothetical protein [Gammaproteobacteria bacterium]MBU1818603.1 hypothetical protein [Gammaproteobacteria bacterium]